MINFIIIKENKRKKNDSNYIINLQFMLDFTIYSSFLLIDNNTHYY